MQPARPVSFDADAYIEASIEIECESSRSIGLTRFLGLFKTYEETAYAVHTFTNSMPSIFKTFANLDVKKIDVDFIKVIAILTISGFRASPPGVVKKLEDLIRLPGISFRLLQTAIMAIAVFRMFLDISSFEKRRIRSLLHNIFLAETSERLHNAAEIGYHSTLSFPLYLRSLGLTEGQLPKNSTAHEDHQESARHVLKFFLGSDGFEEHLRRNQGVKDALAHLDSFSSSKIEQDFVVLDKDDDEEWMIDIFGFVHV